MLTNDVTSDVVNYTTAIIACGDGGRSDSALSLLRSMHEEGVVVPHTAPCPTLRATTRRFLLLCRPDRGAPTEHLDKDGDVSVSTIASPPNMCFGSFFGLRSGIVDYLTIFVASVGGTRAVVSSQRQITLFGTNET